MHNPSILPASARTIAKAGSSKSGLSNPSPMTAASVRQTGCASCSASAWVSHSPIIAQIFKDPNHAAAAKLTWQAVRHRERSCLHTLLLGRLYRQPSDAAPRRRENGIRDRGGHSGCSRFAQAARISRARHYMGLDWWRFIDAQRRIRVKVALFDSAVLDRYRAAQRSRSMKRTILSAMRTKLVDKVQAQFYVHVGWQIALKFSRLLTTGRTI